MNITHIHGREVLDSRGNPTVEADVLLDSGARGRATVPSGASTGTHEAVELRDNNPARFLGKGVQNAVAHVNEDIAKALTGMDAANQTDIDTTLCALDGTENKGRLGANAILAVSLATAHAAAAEQHRPLYEHIASLVGTTPPSSLPLPFMNVINGGKHAAGSTDIQEFLIAPIGAPSFREAVRMGAEVFHTLGDILQKHGYGTTVGDEGGYAPHVKHGNAEALDMMCQAITDAGYITGKDIALALDVAASELSSENGYTLATEKCSLSAAECVEWYEQLATTYPLISIEDGLSENDWEGWKLLTERLGDRLQLVGDDLLVTNVSFLQKAIAEKAGNAILIKPNQIGTLTETLNAITIAKKAGWHTMISHRSGETEDVTIAHIAVGTGAGQLKTGSLSRTDRTAKYNELMRIEEMLGASAVYVGKDALRLS